MAALVTAAIVAVALYLFFFVFFPIARGAIYDPSSRAEAEAMARLADVRPGENAADLGSGDGRVVCALARAGAMAHGYEINPILVLVSRRNIRREGLAGRAFIHWGNFWRKRLSRYTLITTFQVGFVMARLEAKLNRELPPGARVVSHYWRFPGLRRKRPRGISTATGLPELREGLLPGRLLHGAEEHGQPPGDGDHVPDCRPKVERKKTIRMWVTRSCRIPCERIPQGVRQRAPRADVAFQK